ncbi:MAG: periplasmic heavy metal sensor [Bryobacteraceae bacterium]
MMRWRSEISFAELSMKSRVLLMLVLPAVLLAQGGPPPGPMAGPMPGPMPGSMPGPMGARGPRPPAAWWEGPWWNNRQVQDLNLSETQKNDINAVLKDYRGRMTDVRSAMQKADADVQAAFNENPVDQKKATDAIERLAATRADLTRTLSQMSLKMRMVFTADQWQEIQRRQPRRFEGGPDGSARRPGMRPQFGPPPPSETKQ